MSYFVFDNIRGCLPDTDPVAWDTFAEAKHSVSDTIKAYREDGYRYERWINLRDVRAKDAKWYGGVTLGCFFHKESEHDIGRAINIVWSAEEEKTDDLE